MTLLLCFMYGFFVVPALTRHIKPMILQFLAVIILALGGGIMISFLLR
jgi:hypothetical protein